MTDPTLIHLAMAYVALSNAHRLDLILPMFEARAVYRSANVGEHRGRQVIAEMMSGFFCQYPDVNWQVRSYREIGPRTVEFDFTLTATQTPDGESIVRYGVERITFSPGGFISNIDVLP